jgi:hypothetical protein
MFGCHLPVNSVAVPGHARWQRPGRHIIHSLFILTGRHVPPPCAQSLWGLAGHVRAASWLGVGAAGRGCLAAGCSRSAPQWAVFLRRTPYFGSCCALEQPLRR